MKNIKSITAVLAITFILASTAIAGEIQTPGRSSAPAPVVKVDVITVDVVLHVLRFLSLL